MLRSFVDIFRPKSPWDRVLAGLQADDEPTRADAVSEIPKIREPAPAPIRQAVVQLLFDPDPALRRSAKRALNNGLAQPAIGELGEALATSGTAAPVLLEVLGSAAPPHCDPIVPQLVAFARRPDVDLRTRSACARILMHMSAPEAKAAVAEITELRRAEAQRSEEEARLHAEQLPDRVPWPTKRLTGGRVMRYLRDTLAKGEGCPLILGDVARVNRLLEQDGFTAAPELEETLATARALDVAAWFAQSYAQRHDLPEDPPYQDPAAAGTWPKGVRPPKRLQCCYDDRTQEALPNVYVSLAPVGASWQLPTFLGFGAWNEHPAPEVMTAAFERWHRLYGAEIIACLDASIECLVARPPTTREAALSLAWEHYVLCSDVVDQIHGDVATLAAHLLDAPVWSFWWD